MNEVALGMHYLHCWPVLHLDLKSANVLLDYKGVAKVPSPNPHPNPHPDRKAGRRQYLGAWLSDVPGPLPPPPA